MPSLRERWDALFRPKVIYQISLSGDAPTQVLNYTASRLYQTQDNLKAVVDFLANNISQLPLKVYKRNGETDRQRDRTSAAARLLWLPNRDMTAYEFVRALSMEYLIFGVCYVWVLPDPDSESGYQMRIIPNEWVKSADFRNAYAPESITIVAKGSAAVTIPRSEFVCFRTYSPGNPGGFISPLSGLKSTLQEQIEASNFRKELWRSSGRLNAQIVRPANVQPWSEEDRKRFVEAFRESWGAGGSKAGSIPVLEDGMEIKPYATSFKEAEWTSSVHLSREAVAAAYGVNPSLVWHSDTQTYASARDNARALYSESLGPILQMFQQRINSFLLPMVGADKGTYVEFDISEKLKGSFEERASILQTSVGGPWMTRNEARADNNLPPIEGGDELIVPLNVIEGGQASPTDSAPKSAPIEKKSAEIRVKGNAQAEESEEIKDILAKFFRRQRNSIMPKIHATDEWWNQDRWDEELVEDLLPIINSIADKHGIAASDVLGKDYSTELTRAYLKAMTAGRAHAINVKTLQDLSAALEAEEEVDDTFDKREAYTEMYGDSLATATAAWAVLEACRQAQSQGYNGLMMKEWVTGSNARGSHAAMNGQRVLFDMPFSNGAMWPGDDNLSPAESCGCNCHTDVIIT